MKDYFKPAYMRWFYSPKTFWSNIEASIYWVKHCWQRAFRGWADCDWWNMAAYLVEIIVPMLKQLKEYQHGYPGQGQASTPEKWDAILDKMIDGFEAAKRVNNDEYYKEITGDSLELIKNAPISEIKEWGEASKKDQKIFHDNMRLFNKWFFALWD